MPPGGGAERGTSEDVHARRGGAGESAVHQPLVRPLPPPLVHGVGGGLPSQRLVWIGKLPCCHFMTILGSQLSYYHKNYPYIESRTRSMV